MLSQSSLTILLMQLFYWKTERAEDELLSGFVPGISTPKCEV